VVALITEDDVYRRPTCKT